MSDHLIDCCSLINLYTGWRGLEPLADVPTIWHVCDAVVRETEYTREYVDGEVRVQPIELARYLATGLLHRESLADEAEYASYLDLASEVDDGEAQAIAIALGRGYTLLTDDVRAARLATERGLTVVSTRVVLERWGASDPAREVQLGGIVRRISALARFNPRAGSEDYAWWRARLEE